VNILGAPDNPHSPPAPAVGTGSLWVFKTPALAHAGEAKLASVWIWGKGLTPLLKSVDGWKKAPPTAAAARSLYRVVSNVVVLWPYPRYFAASSDRIVNACLHA
jgi:hypothetical protein